MLLRQSPSGCITRNSARGPRSSGWRGNPLSAPRSSRRCAVEHSAINASLKLEIAHGADAVGAWRKLLLMSCCHKQRGTSGVFRALAPSPHLLTLLKCTLLCSQDLFHSLSMLQNKNARVAVQVLKLVVYAALVLRARCAGGAAELTCKGRCGQSFIERSDGTHCHCDYWCNNRDDCCGGTASKDTLCPNLRCVLTDHHPMLGHHQPTSIRCHHTCFRPGVHCTCSSNHTSSPVSWPKRTVAYLLGTCSSHSRSALMVPEDVSHGVCVPAPAPAGQQPTRHICQCVMRPWRHQAT